MSVRHEESSEQIAVADYLRWRKSLFTAIPHGGFRRPVEAAILKAEGVQKGAPDLIIFERPPLVVDAGKMGIAIEMKRVKGGRTSDEQEAFIEGLRKQGWIAEVCNGADKALSLLKSWGV